jgi:hypothetical protein
MLGKVLAVSSPSVVVAPLTVVSVDPVVAVGEVVVAASAASVVVAAAVDGVVVLSSESAHAATARAATMASGATFLRARDDMIHLGCFDEAPDGAVLYLPLVSRPPNRARYVTAGSQAGLFAS